MVATLIEKHNAQVEWRPFYLRPDTPPEGMELPDYVKSRAAQSHARLKQKANDYGMEMVFATRIPNTRIAHEATEYARQKGKGFEFHHVVFGKFYGRGEDVSKWDVLRDAALQVGLDADEMQSEVEAGKYTATVNALVKEASQIGVTGVPTYVLNDRYAIVGAQPYEVFIQALEQIKKEQK
ncbi:MAG: DsbA family oxidoreductase [Anaerolineaceae bacterium]|nr:MAG: DsbA family oxidoreductase [Anaerolineaceae bacterium]